jgi:hypothetical protein
MTQVVRPMGEDELEEIKILEERVATAAAQVGSPK